MGAFGRGVNRAWKGAELCARGGLHIVDCASWSRACRLWDGGLCVGRGGQWTTSGPPVVIPSRQACPVPSPLTVDRTCLYVQAHGHKNQHVRPASAREGCWPPRTSCSTKRRAHRRSTRDRAGLVREGDASTSAYGARTQLIRLTSKGPATAHAVAHRAHAPQRETPRERLPRRVSRPRRVAGRA